MGGGTCGSCGTCGGSRMHWACCLCPILGKVLWVLALVSLILAWSAKDGMMWGWGAGMWYWNALVMGVLAIPGASKKAGSCKCSCGPTCAAK